MKYGVQLAKNKNVLI